MSEWKEYRLGDIIEIKSGFAYKGDMIGYGENILLGMGCVSYKERFLMSGARTYAGNCADRYCANSGDIVLATRQQSDNLPILGMPAIIPNGSFINGQNTILITLSVSQKIRQLLWAILNEAN